MGALAKAARARLTPEKEGAPAQRDVLTKLERSVLFMAAAGCWLGGRWSMMQKEPYKLNHGGIHSAEVGDREQHHGQDCWRGLQNSERRESTATHLLLVAEYLSALSDVSASSCRRLSILQVSEPPLLHASSTIQKKTCFLPYFTSTKKQGGEDDTTRSPAHLQHYKARADMVVSPAVLSKGKKAKQTGSVSFSDEARTSSPVASTSKVPIASSNEEEAEMEDDGVEGDGEWQSRQSAGHPGASSTTDEANGNGDAGENNNEDDDGDDAVMIDSNTLLPPVGGSHASDGAAAGVEQGLLKFPALSAKDMQGKVETQTRKVSVSTIACYAPGHFVDLFADLAMLLLTPPRHLKILPTRACVPAVTAICYSSTPDCM